MAKSKRAAMREQSGHHIDFRQFSSYKMHSNSTRASRQGDQNEAGHNRTRMRLRNTGCYKLLETFSIGIPLCSCPLTVRLRRAGRRIWAPLLTGPIRVPVGMTFTIIGIISTAPRQSNPPLAPLAVIGGAGSYIGARGRAR